VIVYPDTSFILSLWHSDDANYAEAIKLFRRFSKETSFFATFDDRQTEVAKVLKFNTNL
jgi:hypothetical protein